MLKNIVKGFEEMIMAYGNLLETGILFCEILIEKGWLIYEVHILV